MPGSPPLPPKLPAGVKRVRRRKPDGTVAEYYYLRANGAKLPSPEDAGFSNALLAAQRASFQAPVAGIAGLIAAHRRSPEFLALAKATKRNRELAFRWLEKLGADIDPRDIRRSHLLDLRDIVAQRSGPAAANSFVSCTSALMIWALDRGKLDLNPAARIKPLPGGEFLPWTDAEIALASEKFPERLRRAVVLALYTGQRVSDLTAMTWGQYDGQRIEVTQKKTKRSLLIPVHPALRAELEAWKADRSSTHILVSKWSRPWSQFALTHAFQRALEGIGIVGRNTHGLRKVAAVRLAEAGCSTHEIAAITGHRSLNMVAHYTRAANQYRLAQEAIVKLEIAGGKIWKKPA